MKKILLAIATAAAMSFVPTFAQAAPAQDPAVVEATKQMLNAMKVRDLMAVSMRQMAQSMPAQMRASVTATINGNPNMTPEQKKEALDRFEKELPALNARTQALFSDPSLVDDMIAEIIPLYAETYTVAELRQLTAFYTSPLGQKMLANTPKLMARSMELGNRVMMPRLQKLMSQSGAKQ